MEQKLEIKGIKTKIEIQKTKRFNVWFLGDEREKNEKKEKYSMVTSRHHMYQEKENLVAFSTIR